MKESFSTKVVYRTHNHSLVLHRGNNHLMTYTNVNRQHSAVLKVAETTQPIGHENSYLTSQIYALQ